MKTVSKFGVLFSVKEECTLLPRPYHTSEGDLQQRGTVQWNSWGISSDTKSRVAA